MDRSDEVVGTETVNVRRVPVRSIAWLDLFDIIYGSNVRLPIRRTKSLAGAKSRPPVSTKAIKSGSIGRKKTRFEDEEVTTHEPLPTPTISVAALAVIPEIVGSLEMIPLFWMVGGPLIASGFRS